MTEERITETSTPDGNTHTHTTVITDQPNSGGGFKWFGLLALIVVAAIAVLVCQSAFNRDPLSARKRDPLGVARIG
jgi:ABC-type transport system involved in multi-copper enzyme maturation permease subunit